MDMLESCLPSRGLAVPKDEFSGDRKPRCRRPLGKGALNILVWRPPC